MGKAKQETSMDFEEQIRAYHEMGTKIAELEQQRKALGATILQQMQEKTMRVADYVVRRCNKFSIQLTIEEARVFDAVKTEEVIDRAKIKALYGLGKVTQGISETQYVQVSFSPDKTQVEH
jgi:hypothetical protein